MRDSTTLLRARLSNDLRAAMKARDAIATPALRSLLAALDNGSAVPVTSAHVPVFGRSGDVPRKVLTERECRVILQAEANNRTAAIIEYEQRGRHDEAAQLRAELAIIARYLEC